LPFLDSAFSPSSGSKFGSGKTISRKLYAIDVTFMMVHHSQSGICLHHPIYSKHAFTCFQVGIGKDRGYKFRCQE
jgi:hypothetical protein